MADEPVKDIVHRRTQEELNIAVYGRVYESFLKKAEALGKERGWITEDVLSCAETMFSQYQQDQVALAKDARMRQLAEPLLEQLQMMLGRRG